MKDDDPQKDRLGKLIDRGKEGSKFVMEYRGKDMDYNDKNPRKADIARRLGVDESWLATVRGEDSQKRLGEYHVWDAAQTIRNHPEREADIRQAETDWLNDPANDNRYVRLYTILDGLKCSR